MQSRPRKSRLASRPEGTTASVTSAVGIEETFGRRRARRTSIYTRTVMWITGLICAAFLLGTLAQAWSNSNLMEQVQKEQQILNQVRTKNTQLQNADQYYDDPGTIESEARQNLGLIRPGDQPIMIINPDNKGQPALQPHKSTPPRTGNWQDWWQIFFGPHIHP